MMIRDPVSTFTSSNTLRAEYLLHLCIMISYLSAVESDLVIADVEIIVHICSNTKRLFGKTLAR